MANAPLVTTWPGNATPVAVCSLDPTSGLVYSPGCANYSILSTAGTSTVDSSGGGIFFGLNCIAVGTTWTATAYDVFGTNTNQLIATQTAAATGFQGNPGSGGTGVRYSGSLILVTTGTPGVWNVLWD